MNRPDATKDTIDDDGFLHTGDIGHIDEEGYVYIVDRVKELIKYGALTWTCVVARVLIHRYKGFQVAPAELEELLQSHEEITDAAVIGKPDEEAGELPKGTLSSERHVTPATSHEIAFIVKKEGSEITEEEIRKFLDEQVAPHKKLRGGVEFIDAIPKSLSGKILRRELKAREVLETDLQPPMDRSTSSWSGHWR